MFAGQALPLHAGGGPVETQIRVVQRLRRNETRSATVPAYDRLIQCLARKKCASHDKRGDRARSYAERADIKRGAFEGKPNVKRIRKQGKNGVKVSLNGASPGFIL